MTLPLWLASGSPRRRQLLTWAGFTIEVHPPTVDESRVETETPEHMAQRLASLKAQSGSRDHITLAADTLVHLDGLILGKPKDRTQAYSHLQLLSGRWHTVTTGVCLQKGELQQAFFVSTQVRFRSLSQREIEAYVATGDADDKAGAYGIQGLGGALLAEIQGSWTNVMGLPLEPVVDGLAQWGLVPHGRPA